MKMLRLISMAMFAILMCVNFVACGGSDDDPTTEGKEDEVGVNGKKLAKIVGTGAYENETYTFNYDDKGRLVESIYTEGSDGSIDVVNKKYTWGNDVIKIDWNTDKYSYSNTLTIEKGLVKLEKSSDENTMFTYNNSNRIVKIEERNDTITAVWNDDKLVSISNSGEWKWNKALIYEKSCQKGYFPFINDMFGETDLLFMAHPEIVGMKTTQLPSTYTRTYDYGVYGSGEKITHLNYKFDNEGYISEIEGEVDGEPYTYTISWK